MAIDLSKLKDKQVAVVSSAGTNLINTLLGVTDGNITVKSWDATTNTISGHYGDQTLILPLDGNQIIYLVGDWAKAPLGPVNLDP